MKMKLFGWALICSVAMVMAGCVKTMDGRTKATVTPFSKDRIVGQYERSVVQVFDAAKAVLNRLGKVNSEDTINKTLTAKLDTRNVWVRVEEVDPRVTKVTVQVRTRAGSTDIDLAAQVEKEIALALVNAK